MTSFNSKDRKNRIALRDVVNLAKIIIKALQLMEKVILQPENSILYQFCIHLLNGPEKFLTVMLICHVWHIQGVDVIIIVS